MALRRIIHSVLSCKFDEATCSSVENLASTNVEAGLVIMEALERSELSNQSETFSSAQVAVYLSYIHRFMLAFGHDKIPPSYKTNICQYLDTKDAELTTVLVQFGQVVMVKDGEMCEYIFRHYFQHRDHPLPLQILMAYADHEGKHFFGQLEVFLKEKATQFLALELLGKIINNQGAHLHKITETNCFTTLLLIIETEETLLVVLSLAVRVLAMLLPFIPASLPPLLERLFTITAKLSLLALKSTHQPLSIQTSDDMKESQQLGVCVGLLVVYLYGMFPCSFLDFIRNSDDKRLHNATKPLLSKMTFNPNLVSGKGNELSIDRWKSRDPHDIVAECMEYARGNGGAMAPDSEVIKNLRKQIVTQQKLLATHDTFREPNPAAQDRFHNAMQKQERMWLQYLLHQYQQRAAHLGREAMLTSARADEALSTNTRIPLLDAEVQSLHAHAHASAQEHARALAQARAWGREVSEHLGKLKEDNDALTERCGSLLFDAELLESSRQELAEEVREKSDRLMQLEMKLQDAYDELSQLEDENLKMRTLNDDLLLWKEQQTSKIGESDMQVLQESIDQRDENVTDLLVQLETANDQINALNENHQADLVLLQQLEQEKAQWQEHMAAARSVLEKQRSVDAVKLKSVEEKYSSVKSLYLGVEKRMLELRSENDRARQ